MECKFNYYIAHNYITHKLYKNTKTNVKNVSRFKMLKLKIVIKKNKNFNVEDSEFERSVKK